MSECRHIQVRVALDGDTIGECNGCGNTVIKEAGTGRWKAPKGMRIMTDHEFDLNDIGQLRDRANAKEASNKGEPVEMMYSTGRWGRMNGIPLWDSAVRYRAIASGACPCCGKPMDIHFVP